MPSRWGFAVRKGWLTDCNYSDLLLLLLLGTSVFTFWSPILVPHARENAEFGFFFLLMVACQFWHKYIKCFKLCINRGSLISARFQCNTKVVILTGLCACGIEHNFFPSCCYSWSSRLLTLVHFHNNFVPVLFFITNPKFCTAEQISRRRYKNKRNPSIGEFK